MTQRARVIALDIETISETGVPASKYFGFLRFHWPETPGTDFVSITLSRPWKNDRVINLRSGFSTEQLSRCHLVLGQELARVWREMVRQPWLQRSFSPFCHLAEFWTREESTFRLRRRLCVLMMI
jgi:hypothetical protein